MESQLFDTLTRSGSLLPRGSGGMGTTGKSSVAAAKKKKKRRKKGKGDSGCQRQAQVWEIFVTIQCAGVPDCLDALACSEPLETCNFTEFVSCFEAATA